MNSFVIKFWKMLISKIRVKTRARLFYAETITALRLALAFLGQLCNKLQLLGSNLEINALFVFQSVTYRYCSTNIVATCP